MIEKGKDTTSRAKHINVCYYFIKEKVDSGEVELVYKPTKQTITDVMTKPLQGEQFVKLRKQLLNSQQLE
jgi:hypothetical protein